MSVKEIKKMHKYESNYAFTDTFKKRQKPLLLLQNIFFLCTK